MDNLRIDGARLWRTIMETAEIGGTPKGGVNRQALTDLDGQVRRRLVAWAEEAGCTVTIDQVGNIFARRPGRDPSLPPVGVGSHLDTQPTGGKFDGILGVLAGLELIRTLNDAGYETEAPIELINWTNEEGARFSPAMLASGVFSGRLTLDYALGRADRDGKLFGEELKRIGFAGAVPPGDHPLAAFFELHIEQGPILEAEAKTIGVVTGVQGIRWLTVTLTGQDSHAGTTPMNHRHDAFQGLARFAVALDRIAREEGGGAVATIGVVDVEPGSTNVVPGIAKATIDLRHPQDEALDRMEQAFRAAAAAIARDLGIAFVFDTTWAAPAVRFDNDCVAAVRAAAEAGGHGHRDIVSGAGHDAANLAAITPTAMVFVPCAGGISHNEAESITAADAAAGADVLLQAVLSVANRKT
jgi:beta-ureidopropionase / N-carbamoyl-L-amino-acid hydrolase